jgi:hypothetical protein
MKQTEEKKKVLEKIFTSWFPAMIWLFVIFYFSDKSTISIGSGGIDSFVLRKFAHVAEFGVLAVLFLFPLIKRCGNKNYLSFLLALGGAILFAFSDEFHQTFIAGRHGNLKDVLIDSLGASLFLQFVAIILFVKKRTLIMFSIFVNLLAIFFLLVNMVQILGLNDEDLDNFSIRQRQQDNINISSETGNVNENLDIEIKMSRIEEELLMKNIDVESKDTPKINKEMNGKERLAETVIPKSILLSVPFSSQAPFGVWDEVHEEACEEMSLIMVKYYLAKRELTPQIAEEEIQKLKKYQLEKKGHFIDSNMREVAEIARDYFGMTNVILEDEITKQIILEHLAVGNPVIIPTAGRLLGNPNFSGLGPLYHNIVIIGFEDGEFITNDPGTRNGKHYRYKFDIIMQAIHDYPGDKNEIEKGAKRGLIFSTNQ